MIESGTVSGKESLDYSLFNTRKETQLSNYCRIGVDKLVYNLEIVARELLFLVFPISSVLL